MTLKYIKQPNNTTCGQTVTAMIAGIPLEESINLYGHDKGTKTSDTMRILGKLGFKTSAIQKIDNRKKWELPNFAGVRMVVNGRKWGHIVAYKDGIFYDPTYGIFESKEAILERYNRGSRKWKFSHYFEVIKE